MTRKDYIAIAAALKSVRDSYAPNWDPNLFRACDDHVRRIASALAADNPRFDMTRFAVASGLKLDS